jgi:hypothetical protein
MMLLIVTSPMVSVCISSCLLPCLTAIGGRQIEVRPPAGSRPTSPHQRGTGTGRLAVPSTDRAMRRPVNDWQTAAQK